MKILQVWNDNKIDDRYYKCIESVNKICTEKNFTHIIVCRSPELFFNLNNTEIVNFDDFIKNVNTDWWVNILQHHQSQSDLVRLEYAKNNPDILYIDADTELLYIPDFMKNDMPYIGDRGNVTDFFIFYVNGNTKFFDDLLMTVQEIRKDPPGSIFVFMDYFSFFFQIDGGRKRINIFPKDAYKRNWFKD